VSKEVNKEQKKFIPYETKDSQVKENISLLNVIFNTKTLK